MTKKEPFNAAFMYLYQSGVIANQKDLAKKIGLSENSISKILSNKVRRVSEETIKKLNASFGNIFNPQFFRGESDVLLTADLFKAHKEAEQKQEELQTPKIDVIDMYAAIIRSVENLSHQLSEEMAALREEREQLRQERQMLLSLIGHHNCKPYTEPDPNYLKAAEKKKTKQTKKTNKQT